MTTGTDEVRWRVVGPLVIGGVLALLVVVGSVFYAAGGTTTSVAAMATSMAGIQTQLQVQANALTHLEDEYRYGGTRMDVQDRHISEIDARLAAMSQQLSELKEQVSREQDKQAAPRR